MVRTHLDQKEQINNQSNQWGERLSSQYCLPWLQIQPDLVFSYWTINFFWTRPNCTGCRASVQLWYVSGIHTRGNISLTMSASHGQHASKQVIHNRSEEDSVCFPLEVNVLRWDAENIKQNIKRIIRSWVFFFFFKRNQILKVCPQMSECDI